MYFRLDATSSGLTLTLRGRLGVQQARPLWDALSVAVLAGKNIRLDARETETIDTSIAQILCRCGSQMQIGEASDGFLSALRLRGLEHFFVKEGLESTAAATIGQAKSRSKRAAKQRQQAA